ncbi:MAG: hypothetical protein AAF614_27860 [Chloroflexota bacterium]
MLKEVFPQIVIGTEDLSQLGFTSDEIARLSNEDLTTIACAMREHLVSE